MYIYIYILKKRQWFKGPHVAPYNVVGPLCFYCDCIFFQHLKNGITSNNKWGTIFGKFKKYSTTYLEPGKMKMIG
jgi:hypothetical protein